MFQNFLKTTFRNLWKNKSFSAINILGLAVGMASAVLIMLWIHNEISYDRFHKNEPVLYEAMNRGVFDGKLNVWDNTPQLLGPTLKKDYPEVVNTARHYSRWFVTKAGEKKISTQALITDASFFNMFSFPLLLGNTATALNNVSSIVVTESMAIKMFGTTDALNKIITIDQDHFTVTGVLKNLPTNTSFQFDYILPWEYLRKIGSDDNDWGNNMVRTYVQVQPGTSLASLNDKIKNITKIHSNGQEDQEVFLYPFSKLHLYSDFENGVAVGGRITIVRLFGVIAAFILLIACINFMNLNTARSEKRAKEVGIRKVAGARKNALVLQFIGESVMVATLSGLIALLLIRFSLPAYDVLVGKALTLPYQSAIFWAAAISFIIVTGIIAGSYPAFFLSSFKPVSVLKGSFKRAHAPVNPRKILVVVQFSFAIVLIICTIMVSQQIKHAQNRDLGYNRNQVLYHWITGDMDKNYGLIKNDLLNTGIATTVTKTASPLSFGISDTWGIQWQGKDPNNKIDFDRFTADEGLVKMAGLQLLSGRDMNLTEFPTDSSAMLLNESAAKAMGFDPFTAIGQTIIDYDRTYHVIGVFKDFVLGSPYSNTKPMIVEGAQSYFNVVHMKLAAGKPAAEQITAIEKIFKKYNPDYPFEYHFVDVDFSLKFDDSQKVATLTGLFAGLTIFISCLGLFGLAMYMAESRIKEIGVRKVLGASVFNITSLLSKEFLSLVLIAILVASPVAWYVMHQWLDNYSYRIPMQWWAFLLAGLASIVVSLITVSFQAIKAALANPVKSLRTE